jgi:hypothetical protein
MFYMKINWQRKINKFLEKKKRAEIKCVGNQQQPIIKWEALLFVIVKSVTKVCIT